jgi:hypothetical protein
MIAETRSDGDLLFVVCPDCGSEFEAPFSRFDPPRLDRHSCGATVLFQAECASGEHRIELVDPERAPALLQKQLMSEDTLRRMLTVVLIWKGAGYGEKR